MHTEKHLTWISQLVLGGQGEVPQETARELESCPTCAPRIAELRRVRTGLARAGAEEREDFAAARALAPTPGAARFRERAEQLAAEDRAARRSRRRGLYALAASVLIVCAGVWFAVRPGPAQSDDGTNLSTEHFTDLSPSGPTARVERFSWRRRLPKRWTFTLRLKPLAAPGVTTPQPEIVITRIESCEWIPPSDSAQPLPSAFDWRVQLVDDTGHVQANSESVRVSPL